RSIEVRRTADVTAVPTWVNRGIVWTKTVVLEAADHAVVTLEVVEHAQIAGAVALDVTTAERDEADQIKFIHQRLVVGAARCELRPLRIAAKTSHFRGEVGIHAVARVLDVVDRVVDQRSTD